MDSKRKVIYKIMPFFLIAAIIVLAGLFFLYGGKKYTVTVSPGIQTERDRYRAGEEVTVKAHNVPDEITDIYVDGTKAVPGTESDDEWVVVKFIMPAHDVNVTTTSVNISADPGEKEETVLVTYMSMTTGTEMPIPYDRYLLIRSSSGELFIDVENHDDGKVRITRYSVDPGAYDEIMKCILDADMPQWSHYDYCEPLDGGYTECRFLYEGSYIKVSTEDNMPEDGYGHLGSVANLFYRYLSSGRKVQ